jgi:acetyltransferase-like isoleucine patch superfamily enzyme
MPSKIAVLRNFLFSKVMVRLTRAYYVHVWGMDIGRGAHISRSARLDLSNPQGVRIGENTCIAFEAAILTHDYVNNRHLPVQIGCNCLIGARAVVMPGVVIGDNCIVGTASVVMRNVPSGSLVMGNPARVMESGILTGPWGARIRPPESSAIGSGDSVPAATAA